MVHERLELWQWPSTSNQHVSTLCTMPFKSLKDFSKGLPSMFQRKANDIKTFFKSPAKKLRRFLRSNTYTIWFDKYCSSCFLCLYRCFNTYSHLSLVKRLCQVVLETPLTLQTSFNNPFLWQQGYKTRPSENHREDLCIVCSCFDAT